jgi:hypothetical protein
MDFIDSIVLKKRQNFELAAIPDTCIGFGPANLREKALN